MGTGDRGRPQGRPPAGESLAELLDEAFRSRTMSLVDLRAQLATRGHRVSLAALSYWRTGQRQPEAPASIDALSDIEEILAMPAGRLLRARAPSKRPGPKVPGADIDEVLPESIPVREALRSLGLMDWQEQMAEEVVHVSLDVDENGSMTRAYGRTMLRALADGACHLPFVIYAGEELPEPLVLERVVGAEVTGHATLDDVGLAIWKLSLPRPMRVGETAIIETVSRLADLGKPDDEYVHHAVRRVAELTVWIRFDPRRLPRRCELLVHSNGRPPTITPVDVSDNDSAHVSVRSFGPGRVGILCQW